MMGVTGDSGRCSWSDFGPDPCHSEAGKPGDLSEGGPDENVDIASRNVRGVA